MDAAAKQEVAEHIMKEVAETGCLYVEAAARWLEENGYNESHYLRSLPLSIIEEIKLEAVNERLIPPSMVEENGPTSLDFLLK